MKKFLLLSAAPLLAFMSGHAEEQPQNFENRISQV